MRPYRISVGPKSNEEGHVKAEVEIGVVHLETEEHQGFPVTSRSWKRNMRQFLHHQYFQKESTLPTP